MIEFFVGHRGPPCSENLVAFTSLGFSLRGRKRSFSTESANCCRSVAPHDLPKSCHFAEYRREYLQHLGDSRPHPVEPQTGARRASRPRADVAHRAVCARLQDHHRFHKDNGRAIRAVCRKFIVLCRPLYPGAGGRLMAARSRLETIGTRTSPPPSSSGAWPRTTRVSLGILRRSTASIAPSRKWPRKARSRP